MLNEVLSVSTEFDRLYPDDSLDPDQLQLLMSSAADFVEKVVFPVNQSGDLEGCTLKDGVVATPAGYPDAFRRYAQNGWLGLPHRKRDGGQSAPLVLAYLIQEMLGSACVSFADYVGCSNFIYRLLDEHASEELRRRYGCGLTDGSVGAAMCMTEAHCGTDLGLIRTRAIRLDDSRFALNGTKIFISGGDQDLTHQIVYVVLARTADAPAGTRGLSLFLVPKWLSDESGAEIRNRVRALGIEHKLGYAGSATCTMTFEGAQGWLIGEPQRGLAIILTMVNALRLLVGGQGLSCAEAAYQSAAEYARTRLQGRALTGPKYPDRIADPLIVHPDVRKTLLSVRAFTEGARLAYYWASLLLDRMRSPDPTESQYASNLLGIVTPVLKAVMSDFGVAACNDCIQIFGGHGYVRDTGIGQYLRDVRIAPIQEGANGILALDLVQRQLIRKGRGPLELLLSEIKATIRLSAQHGVESARLGRELDDAVAELAETTDRLLQRCALDPNEAGAGATDYQRLLGLVILGWCWLRMACVSEARLGDEVDGRQFYADKLSTARFFYARLLPQRHSLVAMLRTGAQPIMGLSDEYFGGSSQ